MTRKKILLVDDASTILMFIETILRKWPYDFVTARDGIDAVAKAEAERPDLILMDIVMPNMTGIEACQELRKKEATKATPIIMVTARAGAESMQAGFESGCTDYITKPINGLELIAKVRSYLGE